MLLITNLFAINSYSLITGEFDWTSREHRLAIAKDLLKQTDELYSYTDTIGYTEITEFEEEVSRVCTSSRHKCIKQIGAKRFHHMQLARYLYFLRQSLQRIINIKSGIEFEIAYWYDVSIRLSEENEKYSAIDDLIKLGVLPKDTFLNNLDLDRSYYYHNSYNTGIIKFILRSYYQHSLIKSNE